MRGDRHYTRDARQSQQDACESQFHRMTFLLLLSSEAFVDSLDEHIRCPIARSRSPAGVVFVRRLRSLDLRQTLALLDSVLNPVANNGDHVAILQNIVFIGKPTAAWNH